MSGGIFVSYRRSDSADFAGRIADFFAYNYPDTALFFDVVAIEPGEDFTAAIRRRVESSEVVLVIIGETWLDVRDANGNRRLDDPDDFVRQEVATALELDARVIPVLLDAAQMPTADGLPDALKPLAVCNAEFVRRGAFHRDMEHLGSFVKSFLDRSTKVVTAATTAQERSPGSVVFETLVKDFERLKALEPYGFIILENDAGQWVQFSRCGENEIEFDLPSSALENDRQKLAAQRLFSESYTMDVTDYGDDDYVYNMSLPLEPGYLSRMVLDVFQHVYGALPSRPLKAQIDI